MCAKKDEFINEFLEQIKNLFKEEVSNWVEKDPPSTYQCNVMSSVDVGCDEFNGKITIFYPKSVFLSFFTKFFMKTPPVELNDDSAEGSKEFMNIIFGNTRKNFDSYNFDSFFSSSLSYEWGDELPHSKSERSRVYSIITKNGDFYINFEL